MLEYYIDTEEDFGYGGSIELRKRISIDEKDVAISQFLSGDADLPKLTISTRVENPWFGRDKFVLFLDIDGLSEVQTTIKWLKVTNYKYVIWESSPNRFWIFVDYIGTIKDCVKKMKTIPGVDREYIDFCEKNKNIFVRAVPKEDKVFTPNNTRSMSMNMGFFDDKVADFISSFKRHWCNFIMNTVINHVISNYNSKNPNNPILPQIPTVSLIPQEESEYDRTVAEAKI